MHHYWDCGLRNVWLANGYAEHQTPYGTGISIADVVGLHQAIGRSLVAKSGKLTGAELRFLRQDMGLSQAELASMLGNEAPTIKLWEKRGGQPKMADRFIRALYREKLDGNAQLLQMIARLTDGECAELDAPLTMQQAGGAWKLAV